MGVLSVAFRPDTYMRGCRIDPKELQMVFTYVISIMFFFLLFSKLGVTMGKITVRTSTVKLLSYSKSNPPNTNLGSDMGSDK